MRDFRALKLSMLLAFAAVVATAVAVDILAAIVALFLLMLLLLVLPFSLLNCEKPFILMVQISRFMFAAIVSFAYQFYVFGLKKISRCV